MCLHSDPHLLVCCFLPQMLSRCVFFLWTLALLSLLPHFAPVVLSLAAGLRFPPSPSNSLHFCFTGCCSLPAFDSLPIPSLSLTRTALPPFLVHSSSHSLSRLFLSPSLDLVYLLAGTHRTSISEGGRFNPVLMLWLHVCSLPRTDLITPVLPQHATITPRIL